MPDPNSELNAAISDLTFNPWGVKDPVFYIAGFDGKKIAYEPFEMFDKIGKANGLSNIELANYLRSIFGFPTDADIQAIKDANAIEGSQQKPIPPTPTCNATIEIMNSFIDFYLRLPVIKKMQGLTQSLSDLASSPQS